MGVLSVYHPDIVEFVTAKSKDEKKLRHFNVSVMVDNKFMNAVENDKEIYLHWPVYDENGSHVEDKSKWEVSKKVRAKEIWDLIMKNAYNNGEPGIFFYDNLNDDNDIWYKEKIVCTNPCFTGDMKLLTADGYKKFSELDGEENLAIIDKDGNVSNGNKVWCSGEKETVKVEFSNGSYIKCTPNHIFMLDDNSECEAQNLFGKRVLGYGETSSKVVSIRHNGKEKVYDFTENNQHWGIVEGFVVHNCAEYLAGTVYGDNTVTKEKLNPSDYGGACNLGSLFLHNFVSNPFSKESKFEYDKLRRTIYVAVRMLDDIIDVNHFPDKIYENYQKAFRTIGLGVTGLADTIAMLGMKYNSLEAREWADDLMNFISSHAFKSSAEIAEEKGTFPFFEKDKYIEGGYLKRHFEYDCWKDTKDAICKYGIRNAKIMSVAPTGTISMTFGNNCSSGIEPIFCLEYERKVKIGGQDDSNIKIVPMQDYAYKIWKDMGEPEEYKDVFVTALEMTVDEHVDMLSKISKHVDMSVSKTINVPTEYPFEDTKDIYMKCWKLGIKGCTIFRPNEIRQGILISDSSTAEKKEEMNYNTVKPISRKKIGTTSGKTYCKKCACGTLYITVNCDDDGNVVEAFVHTSKGGICQANINALTRMASLNMRSGVEIEEIVDQLKGITCPACAKLMAKGESLSGISCPDILGKTIKEFYDTKNSCVNNAQEEKENYRAENKDSPNSSECCPECGAKIIRQGGCVQCLDCGWSKCE